MITTPISAREEQVGKQIVDAAYTLHRNLGPGLLESIYKACFCHELGKRRLSYQTEVIVPLQYDGIRFNAGLRLDVLVEDLVICELKAVVDMNPVYSAQLLTYLKITNKRLGYLINFNVPLIKNGIKRIAL